MKTIFAPETIMKILKELVEIKLFRPIIFEKIYSDVYSDAFSLKTEGKLGNFLPALCSLMFALVMFSYKLV